MDQPTWIGRSLNNRYKISALLGKGGMSAVYKANDPNLKRIVAIKLIHPHLSTDPNFIHRFKKEAAAVAAFRHPNIVQVYDFSVDGDVYYMVLEFIPGETLQDRLKDLKKSNTRMPIEQAIRIVINICDAMGYAHRNGMIHRDIKPANIMLDVQGQAILMDFGIVKIVDDQTHTATGAVVGTARYMSPEVIRSEMPDERSDIYSLGVTSFEMLSGNPPFDAPSAMSLLMRHLNDPIPDLHNLRPDIPAEVVAVINKSLEKDRGKRYRSADEMAGDLGRILARLEADPVPSTSPSPMPESRVDEPATEVIPSVVHEDRTEAMTLAEPSLTREVSEVDPAAMVDEPTGSASMGLTVPETMEPAFSVPEAPLDRGKDERPVTRTTFSPVLLFGGGGILILILLLAGWYLFNNVLAAPPAPTATETSAPTMTASATEPAALLVNTASPTATQTPTLAPTVTSTLPPLYVRINNITINASNHYVVEYETFGYTEILPGQHVHFFFNTVPPERAGNPATGPWELYGGPRPFERYRVSDRPAAATQMCALVANPNHSVILESGNCFDLP
jgi:serine/threonine protein kinase